MAGAIGALAVRVTADTSKYNRNMRNTSGPANNMRKRMNSVGKAAAKMGTALAAAGVAITTALVKKGLKAVDAASKLSRVLGTTTAGVQAMNRAAELSGIATEKMQQNMRAYTKRLGEAVQGTGEAKNALDELGLSATELSEMPLDQQMKVIGERLDGVATASEKAAIMSDLFSRSGVDMVNVFENGGAVLDKARKEVTAFGVAVSDVDAATIERTNDAFSTIGEVIQGIANRLAVKFAPIIEAIANKFRGVAMETNGFQGAIETAFSVGVKAVGFFADMLRGLRVVIKGIAVAFQGLGTGILSVASMVQEGWLRIFELIVTGVQKAAATVNKIPFVPDIPLDGIKSFRAELEGSADQQQVLRDRMKASLAQSARELKDLAGQPMPSDKIDAFVASVTEASKRISEETVKAREDLANMPNPAGEGEGGGDSDKRKRMKEQLEQMKARLEGERELIKLDYEKKLEQLQIFRENKLVTDAEYDELEKQLEAEKQDRLTEVTKKGAKARAEAEEAAAERQRNATVTAMNNIVSAVGSGSKKAFKIQQAASISTAVIKGWEAAVNAWNAGMSTGGPYAPAIAAAYTAASLAKTGAQIASIKSQSFGSGGSTSGGGGGGGGLPSAGSTGNARTDTGGGGNGARYDVTLAMQGGSMVSDDQIEGIANRLGDLVKDGGSIGGVRFARE